MFPFRSLANRWAIVQTVALLASCLAFVGLQTWYLEREDAREARRLVAEHARVWAEAHRGGSLTEIDRALSSGGFAEAELGLGLRVVGADGTIAVSQGVLSDRRIQAAPDSASTEEGPISFVRSSEGSQALVGFQTRLEDGGWVQAALEPPARERVGHVAIVSAVGMGGVAILIVLFIGRPVAIRGLEPLGAVLAATERLSATRRMEYVQVTGAGGEVDRLAGAFNAMMDRLAAGVERMQRFSANVAHELRAPMSRIRNRVEAQLEELGTESPVDEAMLEQTLADVDRLNSTVRAMLQLAHSEAALGDVGLRPVCLREVLEGVVDFFSPVAEDAEIELELSTFEEALVEGDSNLLHELFGNLVDNAIKFTSAGRCVRVGLAVVDGEILAFVKDEGPGIAAHERDRIFQAFLRLDTSVPGSGLGLSLAREIAHAHRGAIYVESQLGKGSKFVVTLPRVSSQAP